MDLIGRGSFERVFKSGVKGKECALKLIEAYIIIKEQNGLN